MFSLVGCDSYEDFIPLEEDYGLWDGYYIYYGNVKCKTTGEDEQTLVNEIYYNDQMERRVWHSHLDIIHPTWTFRVAVSLWKNSSLRSLKTQRLRFVTSFRHRSGSPRKPIG